MKYTVQINQGKNLEIEVKNQEIDVKNQEIFLDGHKLDYDFIEIGSKVFHVLKNGKSYHIEIGSEEPKGSYTVFINKKPIHLSLKDSLTTLLEKLGMSEVSLKKAQQIKAPMPGLILKVLVKTGDIIQAGDPIVILEAMKMENLIKASAPATVTEVLIKEGQKVEKGESLILF